MIKEFLLFTNKSFVINKIHHGKEKDHLQWGILTVKLAIAKLLPDIFMTALSAVQQILWTVKYATKFHTYVHIEQKEIECLQS